MLKVYSFIQICSRTNQSLTHSHLILAISPLLGLSSATFVSHHHRHLGHSLSSPPPPPCSLTVPPSSSPQLASNRHFAPSSRVQSRLYCCVLKMSLLLAMPPLVTASLASCSELTAAAVPPLSHFLPSSSNQSSLSILLILAV